jgi:membrane protein YdbS with pleckstrin-like domain
MQTERKQLMEWIFWVVLFTIALTFQLNAVFTGNRWGMLTSSVRWMRARLWGRLVVLPAWTWLTWHWFIEPKSLGYGVFWDDAIAITIGVALAAYLDYKDYFATNYESLDENETP